MTRGTLVLRGLVYHWRAHLGVLLGAAVGGAVLVGALLVGDSVRYTLREMAAARLGGVRLALPGGERTFRAELAEDFAHAAGGRAAPVLMLSGTAARADGASRANRVQVLGIEPRFWALGGGRDPLAGAPPDSVVLNERLAGRLGAGPGDTVILRMQKPSRLSRDAPLSPEEDAAVAWRLTVAGVAGDADFGRFSLQANQVPPFNAYVPLERLQAKVAVPGRVNLLLSDAEGPAEEAGAKLAGAWRLEDADLSLKAAPLGPELRSGRVFVDAPISAAALKPIEGAAPPRGILTYLVNELRFGEKSVPYSMVAALDGEPIPAGLGDEEIAVNAWLAEDLGCKTGDEIELAYFEVGAMRTLVEVSARFKVRAVVPLEGAARDPSLMPDFPGLKDSKDCKDWDPGFPLKLDRIRDRDETYWDEHKGTPKAFVSLKAGRAMWANRFGDLTAVRYPGATEEAVREALRARLRPEMAGLAFVDAGAQARIAGAQALDFGPLFIGFSFFLIAAAVLLMGLLFAFGVERRASETGILLAVGFRPGVARRLMLLEAAVPAALGGALGTLGGLVYARAMLHGLSTLWRDAVRTSALRFHAEPATLAIGALASTLVAFGAIWLVLRRQRKLEARELLAGSAEGAGPAPAGGTRLRIAAALCGLGAAGLAFSMAGRRDPAAAGAFFGAGALLLAAALSGCALGLRRLGRADSSRPTLGAIGLRAAARRRGRSLATVGLLACGSFLVISVGAFRLDAESGAERRESGTGGFALYAEAAFPIVYDLNLAGGRRQFALDDEPLAGAAFVPFRLREGDEASCLNLNRAQTPRLLGVRPNALAERKAFAFAEVLPGLPAAENPWLLLDRALPDGAVPAVADQNSILWALGRKVGDTLEFRDERGNPFQVRLVAGLANSILQGSLIVSERAFVEKYPSEAGYRIFLVDAPFEKREALSAYLSRQLQDAGLEVQPAALRLAEFNAVQNTYLSTFQVLGGLGLMLGSLGLGVVLLRNVLERRGELGVLRAVGFRVGTLEKLVAGEHGALLLAGLACGMGAAALAVLPTGASLAYGTLGLTLLGVLACGAGITWLAARWALRGELIEALQEE